MSKLISASTTLLVVLALNSTVSAASTEAEPQPIRQAIMKAQILKSTYIKNPAGDYDSKTEIVCTKTAKVDVFDNRGTRRLGGLAPAIECDSTSGGKPVKVQISGQVNITNIESPITNTKEDVKTWNPLLMVVPKLYVPGQKDYQPTYSIIATKNIDLQSLMTELWPSDFSMECSSSSSSSSPSSSNNATTQNMHRSVNDPKQRCSVTHPEIFSAHVELEDAP